MTAGSVTTTTTASPAKLREGTVQEQMSPVDTWATGGGISQSWAAPRVPREQDLPILKECGLQATIRSHAGSSTKGAETRGIFYKSSWSPLLVWA